MSAPPRLFYTVGVIPNDGQRPVLVSRSVPYTSLESGLEFLNNALVTTPLNAFIPVTVEEPPIE